MNIKVFAREHPIGSYFGLVFFISWIGALLLVAPKLIRHEAISKLDGLLMFPIMILGPGFAGIFLTKLVDGKNGIRDFRARLFRGSVDVRWYAALLIPPIAVLIVLFLLKNFVAQDFTPNFFPVGILFGIPAGIIEELGWTGYAFPKMNLKFGNFTAAVLLGLLWGFWHLPVIDFLGTASPHGNYLLPFFIAFIAAMTAMRVIIAWIYTNTKSILLAQLMHISSTGSLVVFGPSPLSASREVLWYGVYAITLWIIALMLRRKFTSKNVE